MIRMESLRRRRRGRDFWLGTPPPRPPLAVAATARFEKDGHDEDDDDDEDRANLDAMLWDSLLDSWGRKAPMPCS